MTARATAINAMPADVDAVYFGPMDRLTSAQTDSLIAAFTARRLPTAPTVYVCAQDRGDGEAPPPAGPERLLCLINAPAIGDVHTFPASEVASCETRSFALLERWGVPESDIILEPDSKNTWENAQFTHNIIQTRHPGASCLLITSAWHLPRAQACFQKAGLDTVPFGVDYISETNRRDFDLLLMPDKLGLYKWELLIKEWIGRLAYQMQGYN